MVTRDDLVKVLWRGGIVDFDNGLNVAVRKLRVALDEVGDAPKYIETLPRVGYRFMGARGAQPEPAIAAILKLPPRARIALGLTLAAFALAIAGAWWWTLRSNSSKAAVPAAHVPSVRARELYLDGIHQRARRDISVMSARSLASEKFEAALKEDPDYAQAWAALAASISVAVPKQTITPGEGVPKARAAAERAIALDDNLAEGHVSLGEIYLDHDRNFAAAKKEFDRALELDPMVLQWAGNYARVLYSARRYAEAIEFLKPLVAANPHYDQAHSVLAWSLIATGDLAGAEQQLRLVAER